LEIVEEEMNSDFGFTENTVPEENIDVRIK